ncbi:hypothetical protein HYALB_00000571 [Hymenoscyphus albidus]|uniref:Uncharacterized protein n=1 Tax=Hymenoscyphus albidus TaxID=595503 RepID=A0A9N9M0V3_9HELO|nr:hypothetical protein HYALB_00000571 [Hymenoscyphus albidus]
MATASSAAEPLAISSASRQPLLPRTQSPNSTMSKKQLRHKGSFVLRTSSEDLGSPHDSIFNASYFSVSDENSNRQEPVSAAQKAAAEENTKAREDKMPSIVIPDVPFLYGQGTMLTTITEQKSNLTMRSITRTKSVDHLCPTKSLTHHDSFCVSKVPRRKQSFSCDDVALIKSAYHDACTTIDVNEGSPTQSIHEIYAQPRAPPHAPPARPSTPPGMPSWTDGQILLAAPRRRANNQEASRFRRWFGFSNSPNSTISSGNSPLCNTQQSPARVQGGIQGRLPPRFRPPRSSYATIDSHPFTRAPIAGVPPQALTIPPTMPNTKRKRLAQRVRFTPPATARDLGLNLVRTATEPTSSSAVIPNTVIQLEPVPQMQAVPMPENREPQVTCPHGRSRRISLRKLRRFRTPSAPPPPYTPRSPFSSAPLLGGSPSSIQSPQEYATPTSLRTTNTPPTNSPIRPTSIFPGNLDIGNPSTENLMSSSPFDAANHSNGEKSRWCWTCKTNRAIEMERGREWEREDPECRVQVFGWVWFAGAEGAEESGEGECVTERN